MSTAENTILGLKMPTDPRWADLASMSIREILTDHAFCEQKAATQCISLIQLYPDKLSLVNALAPVVTEEWGHFRMVWSEMKKRGFELGKQRKDDYVNRLIQKDPKGLPSEERMLHKLMLCALIEARSCERFRLLSEGLEEESMRKFYYRFMVSEAGHYRLFIDLAEEYYSRETVRQAWNYWLQAETEVLASLETRGDRIH
ncbi:MAG: tRNA-(ms[2]io[6]A)-hydroxylase [Sphingobacteriales bacterium]|nr:MAG: tRNA-(ms[2]io[6]A)-hydroxylase [Sphingobacteriales bacterium]